VTARRSVDDLLAAARRGLRRREPLEAATALADGALLVDIRSESERAHDGLVPGALFIARNVLEWRLDPASPHRHPAIDGHRGELIVMCDEGYQSSLAAANLAQMLGPERVSDLAGGFQAWRAQGLPVDPSPGDRETD
jgi:rhodanese-related sulfurtransferase